jgi:hypothetical protein
LLPNPSRAIWRLDDERSNRGVRLSPYFARVTIPVITRTAYVFRGWMVE